MSKTVFDKSSSDYSPEQSQLVDFLNRYLEDTPHYLSASMSSEQENGLSENIKSELINRIKNDLKSDPAVKSSLINNLYDDDSENKNSNLSLEEIENGLKEVFKALEDRGFKLKLKNTEENTHSDNGTLHLPLENSYHLVYMTPEEIFNKYIASQNPAESLRFFKQLRACHDFNIEDTWAITQIFQFVTQANYYLLKEDSESYNWNTFNEFLQFEEFTKMYLDYELPDEINAVATDYFSRSLGMAKIPLNMKREEAENSFEQHKEYVAKLLSAFELNEDVKQLLFKLNSYFKPDEDKAELYQLIANIKYDGTVPSDVREAIHERIGISKKLLTYLLAEQTNLHNIVHGLIGHDQNQFFSGMDGYVHTYFDNEHRKNATLESLNLNDVINLFLTDYFTKIQNHESIISENVMELMFSYYDEKIFHAFVERYKIPKNIVIRRTMLEDDREVSYYLSLIEYAMYLGNHDVAASLARLGFGLMPFYNKVIEGDKVYHYDYKPYTNFSESDENSILFFIEHGVLHQDVVIDYVDNHEKEVSNNIFFYLLFRQFHEAFLRLYQKTKEENHFFTLKTVHSPSKTDLLLYAIQQGESNSYNFNYRILDIFIAEGFDPLARNYRGVNVVDVLKKFDVEMIVEMVSYLSDIFPESMKRFLPAVTEEVIQEKSQDVLIQWFDPEKLNKHLTKIDKERDSVNKEYIRYMLSDTHHLKKTLVVTDESFFDKLQNQFPNFEAVIKFYKAQFRLKKLSGRNYITPVLLMGEPGIGKTYFAKKLAEYLGTGYSFLDMASVTANWVLTGNNGTWKSAKQGKILEAMMNSNTVNPVFLMDEIEKARSGEFDPTASLYQLLEEINAKAFTDEFVDFTFDASGIIYVACANSTGNLSDPLLSRFKIINVPKPNSEQLNSIIHNIYREATQNAKIFADELSPEAVDMLKGETLRSIKLMIDEAIGGALLDMDMPEMERRILDQDKLTLTLKHFNLIEKRRHMGF